MSETIIMPGSSWIMSERIPLLVSVLPCQCGVCRSTSVPRLKVYQRTRCPTFMVGTGPLP